MRAWAGLVLLQRRFLGRGRKRETAGYRLAEAAANFLSPRTVTSEFGKRWLEDAEFFDDLSRLQVDNLRSADRKFFLRELLALVDPLPGDTAECGVFKGASSWLIASRLRGRGRTHHVFDSFQGVSEPGPGEEAYWYGGELAVGEAFARRALEGLAVAWHVGWIPARFGEVADRQFCFVHIDVDLYQPTLDSLEFFYPRMVTGGIIVCDDYGFRACPGAFRACNEFMSDRPEHIVQVPTGQALIVKRA